MNMLAIVLVVLSLFVDGLPGWVLFFIGVYLLVFGED